MPFHHISLGSSKLQAVFCSGNGRNWGWETTGSREHWQRLCWKIAVRISHGSGHISLLTAQVTAAEQGPALSISQLWPHASLAVPFSRPLVWLPCTTPGRPQPLPQGVLDFCCPESLTETSWIHQNRRCFKKFLVLRIKYSI